MDFKKCFFDTANYELTNKLLGSGVFGKVYVVKNVDNDELYAAKIINSRGFFSSHDQEMLLRESLILCKLNHPAIVNFFGINFHSFDDPFNLEPTILTEYMPNGSLKEILDKEKKSISDSNWSPTKKYISLLGISDAMRYLHQVGVIHRDLKPQNILMDSNYYPRVCDFGLSRCFSNSLTNSMQLSMTGKVGTPLYMAPELLLEDDHYGPAVDVYAFAILAYEIVTGKEPFSEKGKTANLKTLLKKITTGGRPEFTEGVQDNMKELITQCWSQDAKDRPSFETIFQKLSSDFTYLDESVDEDEINEYLDNLEESKMQTVKDDLNDPLKKQEAHIKKIEEENKEIRTEVVKLKEENKKMKDQLIKSEEIQAELVKLKEENKKIKDQLNKSEEIQAELVKLKEENKQIKDQLIKSEEIQAELVKLKEENKKIKDQLIKNEGNGKELVEDKQVSRADEQSPSKHPCKLIVHVIKGEKLRKLDANASSPYVTLQIKGDPDSLKRTKTIDNDLNPVWNEIFVYHCKDWNTDALVVNMMDEDIKHNDKMMNELEFPLSNWPLGTSIGFNEEIKLKKKDAGRLYLNIDFLEENGEIIKGTIIGANNLPNTNDKNFNHYVVLKVISKEGNKGEVVKSEIQYDSLDPVWNKDFCFRNAKKEDTLIANVFKVHKLLGDQCIACVEIPLNDLNVNEPFKQSFKLEKPPRVPKFLKTVIDFGTLTLSLSRF